MSDSPRSLLIEGVDLDIGSPTTTAPARLLIVDDGDTATVSTADDRHILLPSPIDLTRWNPSRVQARASSDLVRLDALPLGNDRSSVRRRVQLAHRARIVVCTPVEHTADGILARRIVELACSGAPLGGELPPAVADVVGPELTDLVRSIDLDDPGCLADERRRALHGLEVRRAAFARFAPRDQWGLIGAALGVEVRSAPSVTVLLPSNRPDDVVEATRRVSVQRDVDVQLVVGLHGSHMPAGLEDALAEHVQGDLVVRRLDDALNLGQVMSELTMCADGDLVSKWDDDDWYDARHLSDLVRALEFSGAAMVGKAAEFVYLEALDLTIRRFASGGERSSTTIAGGTLLLSRSDLRTVGWAPVPRQVDRQLIESLQSRGLGTYRTHGFGYVLRRRGTALAQHTWQAGDGYFLRQAADQRRGLDLEFAGIDEGSLQ